MSSRRLLDSVVVLALALMICFAFAATASAQITDDQAPGIPIGVGSVNGVLDISTDAQDWYCVQLVEGVPVSITTDQFYMSLDSPDGTSINWDYGTYTPALTGVYRLQVYAGRYSWEDRTGPYTLTVSGGATRPSTATTWDVLKGTASVPYGSTAYISAAVAPSWAPTLHLLADQAKVEQSADGVAWTSVGPLTGSDGVFLQAVNPTSKTFYRFVWTGSGPWAGSISPTIVITPTHAITPYAGAGGSISPNAALEVERGSGKTFTITPSAGYHIADVKVDGVSVGAVSSYTFANVDSAHTISATFAVTKRPAKVSLRASTKSVKRGRYVTLTARLSGGSYFAWGTRVRLEVRKPGSSRYRLLRTVYVNSSGVAQYAYKVGTKGTRYHRVRFLGNDAYLAAPTSAGVKLRVR